MLLLAFAQDDGVFESGVLLFSKHDWATKLRGQWRAHNTRA